MNIILGFLSSAGTWVSVLTAAFLLYFRSFHLGYFVIGSVITALTAKILKNTIKQPRPSHSSDIRSKISYGMPSSHSQVVIFFAVYIHLAFSSNWIEYSLGRSILVLVVQLVAFLIVWSRVELGHHTLAQVLVGSALGAAMALSWFLLWQEVGHRYEDEYRGDIFIIGYQKARSLIQPL
ncbi:phosphatidic acid phosphatase type 2/haloperoxidase [Phycomyces nitens]|nr:phosphatidic acid phosphatase type 2/haloperoxidase [Phycomyces nitens]